MAASEEGGIQEAVRGGLGVCARPSEFHSESEEGLLERLCSMESLSSLPSGDAGAAVMRGPRGSFEVGGS